MRPQTTRQLIQQSFRALLMVKPLDRITVRDIVEECGLTRNTFYYHYEDIYDLFDDYLETCTREAVQQLPPQSPWSEVLMQTLYAVFETPQTARHVFFSKKQDTLQRYLQRVIAESIDRQAERSNVQCTAGDRRLICAACSHALYGLMEQWLVGADAANLERNVRRVLELFEGAIHSAMERSAGKKEVKQ